MGTCKDSPKPYKSLGLLFGSMVLGGTLSGCSTPGSNALYLPWSLPPPVASAPNGQTVRPSAPSVPPRTTTQQPPHPNPYQPSVPSYQQGLHGDYASYPAMRQFIGKMNKQHGFELAFLEQTFSGVKRDSEVLRKAGAPAEGQGWRAYRPIFLTEERIRGGVEFWKRHESLFTQASNRYGVAPEYLVAIIGVETHYGKNTGKHNVLQALTTLAFDFKRRADFYQKELEQFLLLSREEKIPPHILKGSYAGAMGLGQFISSSYRAYSLDANRDGKRDLWNPQDAIPSVANYFAKNGWKRGQGVAVPASISGSSYAKIAQTKARKPTKTLSQLAAYGVRPQGSINSSKVNLIRLTGSKDEYWVGGENFYAITRYNPSVKYAMAVHQLAQEIRKRKFSF